MYLKILSAPERLPGDERVHCCIVTHMKCTTVEEVLVQWIRSTHLFRKIDIQLQQRDLAEDRSTCAVLYSLFTQRCGLDNTESC